MAAIPACFHTVILSSRATPFGIHGLLHIVARVQIYSKLSLEVRSYALREFIQSKKIAFIFILLGSAGCLELCQSHIY